MHPQHMYHHAHQQQPYAAYHGGGGGGSGGSNGPGTGPGPRPTARSSSSQLSSMGQHHQHHQHHQIHQHHHQIPQTPFDTAYGASMLPRQLLMGSPFVQTPVTASPSRAYFNGGGGADSAAAAAAYASTSRDSYFPAVISGSPAPVIGNPPETARRRGYSQMPRPPTLRSLSVSSSSTSFTDYNNGSGVNVGAGAQGKPHGYSRAGASTGAGAATSASAAASAAASATSRSIVLRDLPKTLALTQILDNVRCGVVENCYFVPDEFRSNATAVVSFLDHRTAKAFYAQASTSHKLAIALNAPDLKVAWTSSGPLTPFVSHAINSDSATRNVYIGSLDAGVSAQFLHDELGRYGHIDTVDLIPDRKIAFVHFTSIASAIKAVEQLPLDPSWHGCKVFYGKDRCASRGDAAGTAASSGAASSADGPADATTTSAPTHTAVKQLAEIGISNNDLLTSTFTQNRAAANALASSGGANNVGNRCVYLGNLHPATTVEEICNIVRGGLLQSIRLIKERHICFLTFVDPLAAVQFFASTNMDGLLVHGRRLKIGWGKHSGPPPNSIALAVTAGASRNLYIGVVSEDPAAEKIPDEKALRADFSKYGDVEQINFFKDGLCAFVNFTNISSAIKCVDDFQREEFDSKFDGRYRSFKISFGKDRCGNPPKVKKNKKGKNKNKLANITEANEAQQAAAQAAQSTPRDSDDKNKSSDALVFASMGITSKSLIDVMAQEEKLKEQMAVAAAQAADRDAANGSAEAEEGADAAAEQHTDADTATDAAADAAADAAVSADADTDAEAGADTPRDESRDASSDASDPEDDPADDSADGPAGGPADASKSDKELFLSPTNSIPLEYDTSDSDSVSIVIGNNDTDLSLLSPSKPSEHTSTATTTEDSQMISAPHPNYKRTTMQKKNSATQFRLTNSRSSSISYDNVPAMYYNNNNNGFNSRQSSKSQLNKYYQQAPQQQQQQQQPQPHQMHMFAQPPQFNAFATSGSQVMAQYLAQSQHENLLYASHVLTQDRSHHGGGSDSDEMNGNRYDDDDDDDDDEVAETLSNGGGRDRSQGRDDANDADQDDDDDDEDDEDGEVGNVHYQPVYYYDEYAAAAAQAQAQAVAAAAAQAAQYSKMYPYPIQQFPYIISAGPPGTPQYAQPYSMPTTPIMGSSQPSTPTRGRGSGGRYKGSYNNNNNNSNNGGRKPSYGPNRNKSFTVQ